MTTQDWWLDFFDGEYADATLTSDTEQIVAFICELCDFSNGTTLLDQCCGKGHLTHAFSQCKLKTFGVDISENFIQFAKTHYQNPACQFTQADAREFILQEPVDIVINWNTSLAYSESDNENLKMLKTLSANLKQEGKFVIPTLNPDYILANFQRFIVKHIPHQNSTIVAIRGSFLDDRMLKSNGLFIYPDGHRLERWGQTKMYTLSGIYVYVFSTWIKGRRGLWRSLFCPLHP